MWWGAELVRRPRGGNDRVSARKTTAEWVRTCPRRRGPQLPPRWGNRTLQLARDDPRRRFGVLGTRTGSEGHATEPRDGLHPTPRGRPTEIVHRASSWRTAVAAKALSPPRNSADSTPRDSTAPLCTSTRNDGDRTATERARRPRAARAPRGREALGEGDPDRFVNSDGFPARKQEAASSLYEVAYSYYEKDTYLKALKQSGQPVKNVPTYVSAQQAAIDNPDRPHRDERILGWTTFTHGERSGRPVRALFPETQSTGSFASRGLSPVCVVVRRPGEFRARTSTVSSDRTTSRA